MRLFLQVLDLDSSLCKQVLYDRGSDARCLHPQYCHPSPKLLPKQRRLRILLRRFSPSLQLFYHRFPIMLPLTPDLEDQMDTVTIRKLLRNFLAGATSGHDASSSFIQSDS